MSARPATLEMTDAFARGSGFGRPVIAALRHLARRFARARQRRALACLTDDQLRDVGLTRAEACREARKGFWR